MRRIGTFIMWPREVLYNQCHEKRTWEAPCFKPELEKKTTKRGNLFRWFRKNNNFFSSENELWISSIIQKSTNSIERIKQFFSNKANEFNKISHITWKKSTGIQISLKLVGSFNNNEMAANLFKSFILLLMFELIMIQLTKILVMD